MPRPKSFDVDTVLDRAVEVFWVNGYAATSMEDLVNHLGINRGSLYATFGSKQELYQQALERYAVSGEEWLAELMGDRATPLHQCLQTLLSSAAEPGDHRGCLVVNAATERNATNPECRRLSSTAMDRIRTILIEGFTARSDELAPGLSPDAAADLTLVAMQGLRVLSTTETEVKAGAAAATVVDTITSSGPPSPR
jgi:TetR/AcrR family transcriptional repressor of nem operon